VSETKSLTLWEEYRLIVFEHRILKKVFWPKRDETKGGWKRLHKEDIYDLHSSSNFFRVIKSRRKWEGHVALMGRGEVCAGFGGET
jgi:hypothetical protein